MISIRHRDTRIDARLFGDQFELQIIRGGREIVDGFMWRRCLASAVRAWGRQTLADLSADVESAWAPWGRRAGRWTLAVTRLGYAHPMASDVPLVGYSHPLPPAPAPTTSAGSVLVWSTHYSVERPARVLAAAPGGGLELVDGVQRRTLPIGGGRILDADALRNTHDGPRATRQHSRALLQARGAADTCAFDWTRAVRALLLAELGANSQTGAAA